MNRLFTICFVVVALMAPIAFAQQGQQPAAISSSTPPPLSPGCSDGSGAIGFCKSGIGIGLEGSGGATGVVGFGGTYGMYGSAENGTAGLYGFGGNYGVEGGWGSVAGVYGLGGTYGGYFFSANHGAYGRGGVSDFFADRGAINFVSPTVSGAMGNVIQITDAVAKIKQLEGVEFDWETIYANDPAQTQFGHHDIGMAAETTQRVVPEVVAVDANGAVVGMDYSRLVPVLVEAIKQLDARITALETENAELRRSQVNNKLMRPAALTQ